ncbi:MAG: hypothetical protein HUJ63_01420 [Enterococcus sp.]|nr:hypothetical protein [Enterococcus sp.]
MKMRLKVLDADEAPDYLTERIDLEHDDDTCKPWIREECDNAFLLWSNVREHHGDMVYDEYRKRMVEIDSPFTEDDEGNAVPKEGLLILPVDMYEHSGISWSLGGGGPRPYPFNCPWDATPAAMYLYCDEERWKRLGGSCEWKFVDGKPSEELLKNAREIAEGEINLMNLCEQDSYYGYRHEVLTTESYNSVKTYPDGKVVEDDVVIKDWEETDSCWQFLVEDATDVDFPVGVPVVSSNEYIAGSVFEQQCFALYDPVSKVYYGGTKEKGDGTREVRFCENPKDAFLMGYRRFFEDNLESYREKCGPGSGGLEIVDVTEKVWSQYPEFVA